ncbi:LamG domain-containing protein [bacterium]|nr:MAG: LamG domain-containing protein [bacterium]
MLRKRGSAKAKLQSAMEYLMTYGWAILIIAVVLGSLFQLGVFNSSSFSPRAPPGACQVFRPSGPGTVTNINLMGVCTGQLPQYVGQFNGQSSYVNVGNPTSLAIAPSFTIEVWAKPNKASSSGMAISCYYAHSSGFFLGQGVPWSASTNWGFRMAGSFGYKGIDMGVSSVGEWVQLSVVVNGTSLKGYVNGRQVVSDVSGGNVVNPVNNYNIGRDPSYGSYFNGTLGNAQIYNTSLSANQILALYLESIGGAPMKLQNLVGWWPLNGNTNDYSGNNNNGVPTAVTFTSQYGK